MSINRIVAFIICIILILGNVKPLDVRAEELEFTEEELQYIDENPIVYIGVDPSFAPYEFIDLDGIYKGIAADYLKLIEIQTGLTFEVVEGLEWHEAHDLALAGEIDILPCVGLTDEREASFVFSDSYQHFQRVLLSRNDDKIYSFSELENVNFGVQRNSSHFGFAMQEYGDIPESYVDNDELLLALSYGEIDSAITNYAASRYRIKELGITNLKIDQVYDIENSGLYIAVNKDKPILRDIVNKALVTITQEERTAISNKWLGIEQAPDYGRVFTTALIIGIIVAFLILIFIFWNYTLQKEIKRRMLVEEELKIAKQEADRANAAKSIFLARMSHEIRTPLNAINGIGYLLENTKTSSIQEQYIKNLKSASYNLLGIVNDILDFSKIEAGEIQVERVDFDLDELLNKTSMILMPKAIEKGINFHVIKDINLNQFYLGDPTRIEQILINLANNAIKFTEKGSVNIEVKMSEEDKETHKVTFIVKDSGIGIRKEQMASLFKPFHQMDSSITRRYGGTGLGLNISKKFVELLGGTIHAESEWEKGSSFIFQIPLTVSENKVEHDLTKVYPDLRGVQVLVYEEDEITKKLLVSYLESYHLSVHCAMSPEDVLRKLRGKEEYRLLVMDINLKTSDSLEIIQVLNQPELKIILLAKNIHEAQYEMAEELGVKHIIMKPVISSILYNSIVQCFGEEIIKESRKNKKRIINNNGINILLVEDNEVNQMIEKEILSQQGYTVYLAENGRIAVEMCKSSNDFHMILMDIHMPEMDGYEATEKIREFNNNIPILALTAVSFSNIKDKCEEVGMDGYLSKPFNPKEMFQTIKHYLKEVEERLKSDKKPCECEKGCSYLDIQQGMLRIGNNEKLYYEILDKYLMDLKDSRVIVEETSKTGDYVTFGKVVHKLKGTSGNVGAIELYQAAKILMDAIRSGLETDMEPYYVEFVSIFNETERIASKCLNKYKIKSMNEEQVQNQTTTKHQGEVYELLIRLDDLLKKSDLDSFKLASEIDSEIVNQDRWVLVKELMHDYKFLRAREELQYLLDLNES